MSCRTRLCVAWAAVFLWCPLGAAQALSEKDLLRRFNEENQRARALGVRSEAVRAEMKLRSLPPAPAVSYSREDAAGSKEDYLVIEQQVPLSGRRALLRQAGDAAVNAQTEILIEFSKADAPHEVEPQDSRLTDRSPQVSLAPGSEATQQRVVGQTVVPRPLGSGLPVYRPPEAESGNASSRNPENPEGRISLRDALALALMQSPELATFAWEIRAREARILQVSRPPNPVINTLVEEIGGFSSVTGPGITGPGGVIQPQATLQLSQLIELGGKRAARQKLAEVSRDLAAWDYETARIDVFTRVTRAFLDVLASQQAVALAEETTSVVEEVQRAVGLRVTAGVVSPIEKTRADVALGAVRIEADRARRTLDADRIRLAALWGSSSARFESAAGDLAVLPPVPTFAELQDRLSQNPELARWAAEVAQRQAALVVERSKRVPDVTISAGYRRFTAIGGNAFVVGASIPLPLFDRNRGGIQEASHRVSKASEEQRATQVRVTSTLAEAYRALSSAKDEVNGLAANVLPGTRSAFEGVTEGYRFGKFGFLEVLDAQRTLVSAGGQYLRALSNYHQAAAEVERLIGAPLAGAASLLSADLK